MQKLVIKGVALASASWIALLAAGGAQAQTAGETPNAVVVPADAQTTEGGLSDIIVTAQRRAENQQDVPISITTVTADTLARTGITTTDQLTALTPGLVFTRQLNGAIPYIRGVGAQSIAPGVEGAVATYVDGVYYMSSVGNLFSFNNVQRVEVLKGPQGTLFGRNATGGLINVITRDPTIEPQLEATVSYGNYKDFQAAAYASIGSGNVAIDFAVQYEDQADGFGRNVTTGNEVYFQRNIGLRSKLLWNITPDDKVILTGDWSRDKSDIGAARDEFPGSVAATGFRAVGGYNVQANQEATVNTRNYGVGLRYEHTLPWGSLSFLNAYRNLDSQYNLDLEVTPVPLLAAFVTAKNTSYQSELLLNGSAARLDFTAGLFFLSAKSKVAPLAVRSAILAAPNYNDFATVGTKSYAAFAQGTYALTDRTKFTAGLRYTIDDRTFSATRIAVAPSPAGAGTVLFSRPGDKANYPKLTWRLALDQQLAENVMVYASYDRGFKSGTFNSAELTQAPVRPETLDAYTIGLKSELFDRTLRFNVSAFHYDYSDIQLARLQNGTMVLLNAAKGRVNGADFELLLAPRIAVGDLQLSAGASYLDGEYTSFPNGPVSVPNPAVCAPVPLQTGPATGGDTICSADLAGNRMIRSPKFTFNLGAQYTVPVGDVDLNFAASYFHSASFFWEPDNRLTQPAYDLLNGSIGLSFGEDKRFSVRVYGRNLTDSRYATYATSGNLGDTRSLAPPRTYGVSFGAKF